MLTLLLIHYGISLILFLFLKGFRSRTLSLDAFILLTMPLLGEVIVITHFLCQKCVKTMQTHELYDLDQEMAVPISLSMRKAEMLGAKELVAVEEALLISDNQTKRQALIYTLKGEVEEQFELLERALKDKDTETAHYAAASITEIKRKLNLLFTKAQKEYEEHPHSEEVVTEYLSILFRYLKVAELDEVSQKRLVTHYFETYTRCFENIVPSVSILKLTVEFSLWLHDNETALHYALKLKSTYPDAIETYRLLLEIYFNLKDSEQFEKVLKQLEGYQRQQDSDVEQLLGIWGDK